MNTPITEHQPAYLPSCWNDDIRMQALFSVFRKKDLNPTGWQEKMNFWVNAINEFCNKTRQAVISADSIRNAFVKGNRYPNCIDDVLTYMCQEGMLVSAEDFSNNGNGGWVSWGYNEMKKSLSWGYNYAMTMLTEPLPQPKKECKFVAIGVIKDVAECVLKKHAELIEQNRAEYVMDYSDFKSQCTDICTEDVLEFVIQFLQREKKVLLFTEDDKQYIKFPKDENDNNRVSESDKAIIKLKRSLDLVSKHVEILEKEINLCTSEMKQLIKEGNKIKAMCVLRKKKRLESELKRKTASADNLETLIIQLKDAESGRHVLEAYSTGVAAMKSCLTNELDADKVDSTMADLQETAEDLAEVENLLARGPEQIDDNLEEELEEILSSETDQQKGQKASPSLQNQEDELIRRLQALKQPSSRVSPTSKGEGCASANRAINRQQHFAALP